MDLRYEAYCSADPLFFDERRDAGVPTRRFVCPGFARPRDGLAFPGEQLLRLSMDVTTGSAGVLLALAAALDGHGTALPFLEPSRIAASPVPTG